MEFDAFDIEIIKEVVLSYTKTNSSIKKVMVNP